MSVATRKLDSFNLQMEEISILSPFLLEDDEWDLSFRETRALHKGSSTLRFGSFNETLKNLVKSFFADAWLNKGLANSSLKRYERAFVCFSKFIDQRFENGFTTKNLNLATANAFEIYLNEINENEMAVSSKVSHYEVMKMFSLFLYNEFEQVMPDGFYFQNKYFNDSTKKKRELEDKTKKTIPLDICHKVMEAIKVEEQEIKETIATGLNKNNALNNAKNRFVYCQILKIIMATGRRASHIINLEKECYRNSRDGEAEGIWVIWEETKTNQGTQEVFVPSPLAEIIVDAIEKTKEITKPLRKTTEDKNKLFLIYGHPKEGNALVRKPEYKNLISFINGRKDRQGFMEKHKVLDENGDVYHLKVHGFRHTRFNEMRQKGVGIGAIQNDAKHISMDMTSIYIDGDETAQKEFYEKADKDELKGDIVEFIKNKQVKMDKFTKDELERYRKNGMTIQLTHYGYCHMEIEAGPCPSGNPCWIGTDGCGCKYHLFSKTDLKTIEDDLEVYKLQKDIEEQQQPNSPLIGHYNAIIERYEEIKKEFD